MRCHRCHHVVLFNDCFSASSNELCIFIDTNVSFLSKDTIVGMNGEPSQGLTTSRRNELLTNFTTGR